MATKWYKLIKRGIALILGLFFLYVLFVLIHGTLTDYQPDDKTTLEPLSTSNQEVLEDSVFSFTIWNLGYGGLGEESELFYDSNGSLYSGGKMIRPPQEYVQKNIQGNRHFVTSIKSDFFLFQEVDVASKRSYFINQLGLIGEELPEYAAFYAPNYKVRRVPIPVLEPWHVYGRTNSGLATYSRFQPESSLRLSLPGAFSWPTRIFQLDRCAALHRYQHTSGKELVVINIHLSAYDEDGALKMTQMNFLRDLALEEYGKGNYVVIGGDWNLCPPFFQFDGFMPGKSGGYSQINIEPDFFPSDWRWAYDPTVPTNRKTKTPYQAGETFITLIDFFLISPNLNVLTVKGLDQGFRFSDHQPVWMEVEVKGSAE